MSEATRPTGNRVSEVYGERVRDARLIQRLKAQDIASAADVSPERYSRIENSVTSQLDPILVRRLAVALDFPERFLAEPPITPVERGSLLFRAKKAMTRGEEDQLSVWARLVGDFLQIAQSAVNLPPVRVPRAVIGQDPRTAAMLTRQKLGLPASEPVGHLIRTLERAGVYVACIDFSAELHAKNHEAFSTHVGQGLEWPLIVLRQVASWERTRLSVAHELGHLVMHQIKRNGDVEREAYAFASEFLLPVESLREEWPRAVTLLSLMPLKKRWGISLAGIIEHGYRNDLLSSAQRTNLYKQLSNRKDRATGERWRNLEPGWNDRQVERPRLLAKVAETAFDSSSDAALLSDRILGWPPRFIRNLIVTEVGENGQLGLRGDKDAPVAVASVTPIERGRSPRNRTGVGSINRQQK